MESLSLYLFISIAIPLISVAIVTKERTRTVSLFLLFGVTAGLFCGEINGLLSKIVTLSTRYYSVNIAPIIEECVKAFPIIVYAFIKKPSRQRPLESSIVMGVGFAILENAFILANNIESISLPLAIVRGIGAGLMHGVCTLAVGEGLDLVSHDKRIAVSGTLGLLGEAIIFHSFYNNMIQSKYAYFSFILPFCAFIIIIIRMKREEQDVETKNQQ